jgi:hypothetical protein
MSPQPHDGPAEKGHSCSTLRAVDDPARVENLRHVLSSFNHRCRNSLNGIKMSLYLCKREVDGPIPRDWLELERAYQELEVLFDRLQMLYRPLSLISVRSPVGRLIDERLPSWRSLFSLRGRTLELAPPADDPAGDFDPMQLGLGLDAFVAWRADSGPADGKTVVSWKIANGFFEVCWDESRCTNGSRVNEHENGQAEGSGSNGRIESLACPLLKRIVAAHGGFVETTNDPTFAVKLWWPQFQFSE